MIARTEVETHRFSINGHFYNYEVQMQAVGFFRLRFGYWNRIKPLMSFWTYPASLQPRGTFPACSPPPPPCGHVCVVPGLWPQARGRQISGVHSNCVVWSGLRRVLSSPSFLGGMHSLLLSTPCAFCLTATVTTYLTVCFIPELHRLDSFESQLLSAGVLIFTAFSCCFCFLDVCFHSSFWIRNQNKN